MTEPDLVQSLVRVIDELRGLLGPEHTALATRLGTVAAELRATPSGDLDGGLLESVRRLPEGTMGSLSDVMLGTRQGQRWVLDHDRDAEFSALRRQLGDLIAQLPELPSGAERGPVDP